MDKKPEWSERPRGISAGQMDAQELPAKHDQHGAPTQRPHESAGAATDVPTRDSRWSQKLPIAILISGRGSNMRAIAERAAAAQLPVDIRVVISDRASAAGLETAAAMGIETQVLSPRDFPDRSSYDTALARLVAKYEPKL
ncbi:MAG TPA: formyltransferase family protein, partial [Steroidobacteraceae bacterium]|nr:formyltransferase family protein [Steroidobacteraceae bacterium]